MTQETNQLSIIKQENELLKKQNEALSQQIIVIQKTTEELDKLHKSAAIGVITSEVQKHIFEMLRNLGLASGISIIGLFISSLISTENAINNSLTTEQIDSFIKGHTLSISNSLTNKLTEDFKKDEEFKEAIINAYLEKVFKDREFIARINAVSEINIKEFSQKVSQEVRQNEQDISGSELSNALNNAIPNSNQTKYFVIAASSTERDSLKKLATATEENLNLKTQICPPSEENERSVLLFTDSNPENSTFKLSLETAKKVEITAKKIEPTAYILPTEPAENVFFDSTKCKKEN